MRQPHQIWQWNGKNGLRNDAPKIQLSKICKLPLTGSKPEGLQFLHRSADHITFWMVDDGLPKGGLRKITCSWPMK